MARIACLLIGAFMLIYPVIRFLQAYAEGTVLLSLTLLLMVLGGLAGIGLACNSKVWRQPGNTSRNGADS